jgi:hypothetical protein
MRGPRKKGGIGFLVCFKCEATVQFGPVTNSFLGDAHSTFFDMILRRLSCLCTSRWAPMATGRPAPGSMDTTVTHWTRPGSPSRTQPLHWHAACQWACAQPWADWDFPPPHLASSCTHFSHAGAGVIQVASADARVTVLLVVWMVELRFIKFSVINCKYWNSQGKFPSRDGGRIRHRLMGTICSIRDTLIGSTYVLQVRGSPSRVYPASVMPPP